MTEPRPPKDIPPADDKPSSTNDTPRGVPPDTDAAEPKGTPHSDRHQTETAGS